MVDSTDGMVDLVEGASDSSLILQWMLSFIQGASEVLRPRAGGKEANMRLRYFWSSKAKVGFETRASVMCLWQS